MNKLISSLIIGVAMATSIFASETKEVSILTDRPEFHMKPIVNWYAENKPDVKLDITYIKDGLAIKAQSNNSYDIVISNEITNLGILKKKGVLSDYLPKGVEHIQENLIKPGYGVISYRARVFFHKKGTESKIHSYKDIIDTDVKICIRPIVHNYNIGLTAQLLTLYPEDIVEKIVNALAKKVTYVGGNDRESVKGLYEGKCDVAIANTYYMGVMKNIPSQKAWADYSEITFPNEHGVGSPILVSGLGITKTGVENPAAVDFYDNIFSKPFQTMLVETTYQYPVRDDVKLTEMVKSFNPNPKVIITDPTLLIENRNTAIELLNKASENAK